ncbi:hypothetical protein EAJ04_25150 [Bacteroides faecis]|nr:hypothetical protein EAJ04_25150 [Bacteroides faecis]
MLVGYHSKPPFFTERKHTINGTTNKKGLMKVRTNINSTNVAFTLATNADLWLLLFALTLIPLYFGIDE